MTAETKVTNYTAEQTAMVKDAYLANPTQATIEALATQLGKTVRSVIAKLAKEDVYKGKPKEIGKREMLKREMVTEIADILGKTEEQLESLEKATGFALMEVLKALRACKEA